MKNIKKEYVFCIIFGGYIAAVLWITLFSRIGTEFRNFLLPFHSYLEISKGNRKFLLENVGNIVMFIPLGIAIKCFGKNKIQEAAIGGAIFSFCIEMIQFIFALGTFEFDDLFHNTLGVVLGFWLASQINVIIRININKSLIKLFFLSILLFISIPFVNEEVRHQKMVEYASMMDQEDGTENLLVLNGKNGTAWDTNVYIKYLTKTSHT